MAAAVDSAEQRELALVEKVELRIALVETDEKLEKLLGIYLGPLLLKLGSEHLSVRNKVISICQHVNTRIKPKNVKLPVAALLKQFNENSQPLIRHFDLTYAQQGLDRLQASDRAELFPTLVKGIAANESASAAHGGSYFNILLRVLADYKFPIKASKEDDVLRESLGLSDRDVSYLTHWFSKLLLLRSQSASSPGLSADEQSFLTLQNKPETWDPSAPSGLNLTETKLVVLKAVASGAFKEHERFTPALCASSDSNSRISSVGEELLKKSTSVLSLEGESVQSLYKLYLGVPSTTAGEPMQIQPANPSLRIKILGILSKSQEALEYPEKIDAIVEQDLLDDALQASNRRSRDIQNERLRSAVALFLTFAVRNASQDRLAIMSREILPKLQQVIEASRTSDIAEDRSFHGRLFEVMGFISASSRQLVVDPELSFLQWLFDSLGQEQDRNVIVSIDEAVSATIRPFQETGTAETQEALVHLLLSNMRKTYRNQRNVVFATLRFANRCLPFQSVVARWIDIAALAGPFGDSHEISEEAKKGLDPYWLQLNRQAGTAQSSVPFPAFTELVQYIFRGKDAVDVDVRVLRSAIPFCRSTLYAQALAREHKAPSFSIDWDRKLDLAIAEDPFTKEAVTNALDTLSGADEGLESLHLLWTGICAALNKDETPAKVAAANFAVELSSLMKTAVLQRYAFTVNEFQGPMLGNDLEVGRAASHIFGLLASCPPLQEQSQLSSILTKLSHTILDWKSAVGSAVNATHGALLGLSYYVSRSYWRSNQVQIDSETLHATRAGTTTQTDALYSLLPVILSILTESHEATLLNAAYQSLAQLCLYRVIHVEDLTKTTTVERLLEALTKGAKAGNERAISALGHLSLILDESSSALTNVISKVRELHEIRQPETQFAVGEALSIVACGWSSSLLLARNDMSGESVRGPQRQSTGPSVVEKILEDCQQTKPSLKKAAVIWALCMLQHGSHDLVKDRLAQFQAAFKKCLTDRDDLVQESAARGLGIVYEHGDRSLKDDLVRDLVGSFSSNRVDMSGTVTEDTQLFEPGALPTGDGSITTYKDIMSLAAEVGDSSLVYRFMSLASSNAIWSSRAAFGRFGLSNVLSDSSVDGYLASNPKLYPKLFRYRFDPNSNVRKSMTDIWNALVKDSGVTIDTHFSAILDDLLTNIVAGRDWRARQASCAAIADLVQGRKHEQVEPHLERIWTLCFKVIDDIKESVRKAAAELARVLSNMLLRSLEASQGQSAAAERMLRRVLPFLMSVQGLESSADDVRGLSIYTLMEIIKKAKAATLRPFIPEIVEKLLGLLSTFEPEQINTVYLNASKFNLKEQEIDDLRLKGVRNSPLMEAIERCIDMLDDETLARVVERVQEVLKGAVGMPTKVGCSRMIVSLCTRRAFLVRPHAGTMLRAVQKRVVDRNDTVSSSYAAAMGYLCRGASNDDILATAEYARRLYFDSEEERRQIVAGEIVLAIAKQATDRFAALAAELLPFVFVARHDESAAVRQAFEETWNDNVGGNRAASLYLDEILAVVDEQLQSRRWGLKHAAALALGEAVQATATASASGIGEREGARLWPRMLLALAEKSWEGKERVLAAFVTLVTQGGPFFRGAGGEAASREVLKVALREAKRRNAAYQAHAMRSLAQLAGVLADEQHAAAVATPEAANAAFDSVVDLARATVDEQLELLSSTTRPDDGGGGGGGGAAGTGLEGARLADGRSRTLAAAIDAAAAVVPAGRAWLAPDALAARCARVLALLAAAARNTAAPVNAALFDAARSLLDRALGSRTDGAPTLLVAAAAAAPPAAAAAAAAAAPGLDGGAPDRTSGAAARHALAIADALAALQELLLARRDVIWPEAVRQRRAEAVLALARSALAAHQLLAQPSSAALADLARLVATAIGLEKAVAVRAVLLQAQALLQSPRDPRPC